MDKNLTEKDHQINDANPDTTVDKGVTESAEVVTEDLKKK